MTVAKQKDEKWGNSTNSGDGKVTGKRIHKNFKWGGMTDGWNKLWQALMHIGQLGVWKNSEFARKQEKESSSGQRI